MKVLDHFTGYSILGEARKSRRSANIFQPFGVGLSVEEALRRETDKIAL
jgi:hypothetical protein